MLFLRDDQKIEMVNIQTGEVKTADLKNLN